MGQEGARAIKRDCICFLNRNGEKLAWENDNLSELEIVSEQPKLVDPGVAEIMLVAEPKEELGGSRETKEKPSYVTRAVAARRHADLGIESVPRQSQGVEVRADNVIVIDDDGNEIQVDIPAPEAPPLSIQIEHEDIPQDPEESEVPALRRSTRNRVQRQLFSPRNKGPYHKAVGFAESGGESRSCDPQDKTPILTGLMEELESVLTGQNRGIGTDTRSEHKGESNLMGNEHLLKTLRELEKSGP